MVVPVTIGILVATLVAGLVLAVLAWSQSRADRTGDVVSRPASPEASLALCEQFIRTVGVVGSALEAAGPRLEPDDRRALQRELEFLDALPADHPDASYQVVNAVSTAGDADALVLAREAYLTFQRAIAGREQAIGEATAVCAEQERRSDDAAP